MRDAFGERNRPVTWGNGISFIRRTLALPMIRSNGLLFASSACVGVANYLLNISAARHFAPGMYSQLGIILNLLAAFAPVSSSVMGAVTRRASVSAIAGDPEQVYATQRSLLRHLSGVYVIALATIFLLGGRLGHFIRLTTITPLYFIAATAFFLFMQALFQGALQAEGRYARLSLIYIGEALFRGIFGVAAIFAGVGLVGVVAIYTASAAVCLLYFPRPQALWTGPGASRRTLGPVYRDIGHLALANLCMIILINLDVVFCRRFLSPDVADHYVAISSMAKFFLFATASVAVIAFTEFVKEIHRGGAVMRLFGLSFAIVIVLGGLFITFAFLFGTLIVGSTFGEGYRASGHSLWITAVTAVAISCINMEVTYFNARNWRWYLPVLLVGGPAMVAMLSFADHRLERYAGIYAAGMIALMLILFFRIIADTVIRRPVASTSGKSIR